MDIRLLGPVTLRFDGERIVLGSLKERAVLAALALDIGRPVALHTLVGRLWEGPAPAHADANTYTYVSRLRRRMMRAARTPDAPGIVGRDHTYTLQAPPETVDWHRYQRLAAAAATDPDDHRAMALFRQAEELWEGEALAGLPGMWAESVRRALAERRLAATVSRVAAELRLGRFHELVPELVALTAQHPGDETLLGHLALAYYGSGRYTDAVRVHELARRVLMEEYGARPGAALQRIHVGVLKRTAVGELVRAATAPPPAATLRARGAVTGATGATGAGPETVPRVPEPRAPASAPPEHAPRNLPSQPPLIGRHDELRALTRTFAAANAEGPVVALESVSGMGGIGKTAVAVHTAASLADVYPDAALYLNLRAHSASQEPLTPTEALTDLLRLLGTPSTNMPLDLAELADLWRTMLARRRAVIVLDDVMDAAQVRPLLPHDTPSLVVLTSRRHLTGLPAARAVQLDVLPVPDAIALFRRFAGHERTHDEAAVARIVRLCGCLPLAIELVANRFQTRNAWTLATLHDRLDRPERLNEIHDTRQDLKNAFDLSYRTLTLPQRQAFRRLSLHPGPDITLPVAAAILNVSPVAAERILESLLDSHMLTEPVPERCIYHDLLAEYARKLTVAEDELQLRQQFELRLILFYVRAVEHADRIAYPRRLRDTDEPAEAAESGREIVDLSAAPPPGMTPFPDAPSAIAWLAAERDNALAVEGLAATHGHPDLAARLAYALAGYLNDECYWPAAVDTLTRAVDHLAAHGTRPALCRALLALSDALASLGQYDRAAETGRQALQLAVDLRDAAAEEEAHLRAGSMMWHRGERTAALEHFQRALTIAEETGDVWFQARMHNNAGIMKLHLGERETALREFQQARDQFAATQDDRRYGIALNNTGDGYAHAGEFELARQAFEDAIVVMERAGNRYQLALAHASLADVLTEIGETEQALALCHQALQVFRSLADSKSQADALTGMGWAYERRADHDRAIACFTDALTLASDIGAAYQVGRARRGLGAMDLRAGRLDAALDHLESAVATADRIHDLDELVEARILLAEAQLAGEQPRTAYRTLRLALSEARAEGHRKLATIERRATEVRDTITVDGTADF